MEERKYFEEDNQGLKPSEPVPANEWPECWPIWDAIDDFIGYGNLILLIVLFLVWAGNLIVYYSPNEIFRREVLSSHFVITVSAQRPPNGPSSALTFKADMYDDASGLQRGSIRETVTFSLTVLYSLYGKELVGILITGAKFRLKDCKEITFVMSDGCMSVDATGKTIHFPLGLYDSNELFQFEK